MKNIVTALLLAATLSGCGVISGIFNKKSPHEKYADKLDDNGMEHTVEGRQWLAASKAALQFPVAVALPYRQNGYFASDKPRALGLKFIAGRGERLTFSVSRKTVPFALYADVFQVKENTPTLLFSADTASAQFTVDIPEPGTYLLRLQPQLFRSGGYSLSVSVGPSLIFPVSGNKAKTGSFWGESRGGGVRRHEGIDIFAPKHTPVVAGADGVVTGVKEGGLGGKVVWMKVPERNIFLYYAHLDKQLVQPGQEVKKGDVLGTVGNTGNARHTPSHLHFGVYTGSGPIDPFPFVNPVVKTAPAAPEKSMANYIRLTKAVRGPGESGQVPANTVLAPVGVTSSGYIAELSDGKLITVPFHSARTSYSPARGGTTATRP